MQKEDWATLLAEINQGIVSEEEFLASSLFTDEQRQSRWLGQPGASEAAIAQLEQRLGQRLPPSYRSFLAASNGFGPISYFIYDLCPTTEVAWLADEEPELVKGWEENADSFSDDPRLEDNPYLHYDEPQIEGILRPGHMRQCLMISHWGDAGFVALNPSQQHKGEWEAWHFANWHPGAVRYRSFAEFMQRTKEEHAEMRKSNEP